MRKNLLLLCLLLSILVLAHDAFSQKKPVDPEIILSISVPKLGPYDVPLKLNRSPKALHEEWFGAGRNCSHCDGDPGPWEYWLAARAYRAGENRVKIGFTIEVDGKCKTTVKFLVTKGEEKTVNLKCGASLKASYAAPVK